MAIESASLISPDNQETLLELSNGDITLGRGPLLGIVEAKVSRVHAVLRLSEDNQIEVKPVSKNPLFYYEKVPGCDTTKRRAIPKDTFFTLDDGDLISFLPDSLRFRLKVKRTENNDLPQTLVDPVEVDTGLPVETVVVVSVQETLDMPIENGDDSSGSELSPNKQINSSLTGDSVRSPCDIETSSAVSPRKRKLPGWMSKNGVATNKVANITPVKEKTIKSSVSNRKKQSKFESTVLPGSRSIDLVDDSMLANLSPVIAVDPLVENTPVIAVNRLSLSKSEISMSYKSEVGDNENPNPETSNQPEKISPDRRQKCQFGRKCYRKNPAHRRELAHPGDSDYVSDSDEASSMISVTPATPICPYGTTCYRKNAAHKANFRHDIDPELDEEDSNASAKRRSSRKRNVRSEQRLDDDYDGTYDYDDSFINDASDLDYESSEEADDLSDEDFEIEELPSTSKNGSGRKNSRKDTGQKKISRRNYVDSSDEESDEEDFNGIIRQSKAFSRSFRKENKKTSKK